MSYNYLFLMLLYMKPLSHVLIVMSTVNPYHSCAYLQSVACCCISHKCVTCCCQIGFITCHACIFLTVTPFGVFFTCILTRISCILCLCYCLLLLNNLKYGLGRNSTKCLISRGVLDVYTRFYSCRLCWASKGRGL